MFSDKVRYKIDYFPHQSTPKEYGQRLLNRKKVRNEGI